MTDAEAQAIYQNGKMSTDQHKWFIVDLLAKCVVASFRESQWAYECATSIFNEDRFMLCDERDMMQYKTRWHNKILVDAGILTQREVNQ